MAHRRTPSRRDAQLAFDALTIEGGLLSPDWLARIAQLSAGQQAEADYRIPKGLNLRDEIGRYWRIAQAHWHEFASGLARIEDTTNATGMDESALASRFVLALLGECFGFTSIASVATIEVAGRSFPIGWAALSNRVPIVVASAASGLDTPSAQFGDGARRRSAFGVAQEYLNAADEATWGIASDGVVLRILRDNASLTRPAWIEADLRRVFTEERYADFAALWLLAHETRFGRPAAESGEKTIDECALNIWRSAGREEGVRAREYLRQGVKEALLALGQGFLSQPENSALRAALQDGSLTKTAYFQQLLRLAYRFIFLITVEERGLLHPLNTPEEARQLYADGYSLRRLRDRAARRSAHDRHSDLWEVTKIVFRGLRLGEPRLGLPALAGLFAATQCPNLNGAKLENRALLAAVFRLAWLRERSGLARVNWRDMGPEELGSVYEGLLELVPQLTLDGRGFAFASGGETQGNARKTSGSYYTPDSLVQVLLDSALEPVVQHAVASHPGKPVEALLGLAIVDPACGSGHFLLAAARRVATHVARLEADGTPSASEYRRALRKVVARCIYGVDLNPMAVELCRVSLWMEAVEPGLPLTFLDSHVQCGNALLGTTAELMAAGVPDAAWDPTEGDDKKTAATLKKRNKQAAAGQRGLNSLWSMPGQGEPAEIARAVANLESSSDIDVDALERKESQWFAILESEAYRHQRFVADAWCAAFMWPKEPGVLAEAAPTNELWRQIRDRQGHPPVLTVSTTTDLATRYGLFHWHLAFPLVFARGGFDVVLGNPPWERININQKEWFAARDPEIASALNVAGRSTQIADLQKTDPTLWTEWANASRSASAFTHFARASGHYPRCAHGDLNSYALFAELNRSLVSATGAVGCILPSGIATDNSTRHFFGSLIEDHSLLSFLEFENEGFFSAGRGHMLRFALVTIGGTTRQRAETDFFFQGQSLLELADRERHFTLSQKDIDLINPNTRTCPIFRTRRDAEITKAIYRRVPVLQRDDVPEGDNPWLVALGRTLHMGDDAGLFRTREELESGGAQLKGNVFTQRGSRMLPLYEAKMVYQFDHRYGDYTDTDTAEREHRLPQVDTARSADPDYVPMPFYWVAEDEVEVRLQRRGWTADWLMGWRDVTDARASLRTVIATAFPRTGTSDKLPLILPKQKPAELLGTLSSFALDYCARQKLGGVSLKQFVFKQLPVLLPDAFEMQATWDTRITVGAWVRSRVLELMYAAWDLRPFALSCGYDGPPFRWNPARRFLLRSELDAAFFHLYGLSRDDSAYVLDTFPVAQRSDEKVHGEYRTKRIILEIHDALTDAARTGRPYTTLLDPVPADPQVAHPSRALRFDITKIPVIVPDLGSEDEAALTIWAMLHASGGTIRRIDLARAFALRSQPEVLAKLAGASLAEVTRGWLDKVGGRTVPSGLLAKVLKALTERDGVKLGTDASAHAVVRASARTPPEDQIDVWFQFEARLALQVLAALPPHDVRTVEAGMSGDDRNLLEAGVA